MGGSVAEESADEKGERDGPGAAWASESRWWGWRLRARVDECAVGAFGDLDDERVGAAFAGVVVAEAGAKATGLDANGGVDGGVVGGVAIEDVEGDAVFLEWIAGVVEGVVDDVAKEELAAVSAGEGARAEDGQQKQVSGVAHGLLRELNAGALRR